MGGNLSVLVLLRLVHVCTCYGLVLVEHRDLIRDFEGSAWGRHRLASAAQSAKTRCANFSGGSQRQARKHRHRLASDVGSPSQDAETITQDSHLLCIAPSDKQKDQQTRASEK